MRAQKIKLVAGIIAAAVILGGLPLFGQGETQTSTGVARVSLIRGDVSMERGDSNEWMAVTVNTPLVPGDSIATGAGSRAEVQLDYSNVVRLADNTVVKIADLNASRIQLQVARGTADFAVLSNNQTNSEVDTPNVAVEPLQPGTYRIDVNSDSLTLVTVRDGQAQISTPQGSTNVNAGQQITVEGAQNPQYQIVDARPLDNWDNWNRDRNGVLESAQNYAHVNQYYTGAQDLGSDGRWVNVPGYDWCWTPYVDAGWIPYSNGRWVWEPYYGWTWVSYEPWGWAPYHYGRWFFWNNVWCWWPGAVTPFYRPLWAPAYVSFIGFGYGYHRFSFGFGYGFDSIGWCPLGPRDRFHHWWGHGRDRSFNVVNINNYYGRGGDHGRGGDFGRGGYRGSNLELAGSNIHVRRAIVTMSANQFGRESVPRNRRVVTTTMLRNADVVHGTLPVVPTRESLRVTNRNAIVPAVARGRANNASFYSRHPVGTPAVDHSFNNQAASIRRMVETHNVRAAGANRGFQNARAGGVQAQGNVRQSPAPVVRENPQGRQSVNRTFGNNTEANRTNMRRFGTGTQPQQARGQGRQNSAPVVRENPQPRGNVAPRSGQSQSNWSRFSQNTPSTSREVPNSSQGRFQGNAPVVRGQQNNSNFRRFTPQPAPQDQGRFNNVRPAPQTNNGGQPGWSRFRPQAQPSQRGGGDFYDGGARNQGYSQPRSERPTYNAPRNYSRPPLQLDKPIVSEPRARSYGGYGGGARPNYGGGSRPSYNGGSRPSYGGGSHGSAPSYHGNSGGGFRGSSSAPSHSSGGGHSGGGGGGPHRR